MTASEEPAPDAGDDAAADRDRFVCLWTQALPAVTAYVSSVVPRSAVDDVMQDTAMAALRLFARYDAARSFGAWAMGIAKMQVLSERRDRLRAKARLSHVVVEQLTEAWEEALPEADPRERALRACLERLSDRSRDLIALRYEHGLANDDIGEKMAMRGSAVRVALSRLRKALQECIERRMARVGLR